MRRGVPLGISITMTTLPGEIVKESGWMVGRIDSYLLLVYLAAEHWNTFFMWCIC